MQDVARWLILGAIAALLVAGCGGKSKASRARAQAGDQYPRRVTFEATAVRSVGWTVPGTRRPVQAKAVTVNARSRGQVIQTFTQHVVRNRRAWAWMLSGAYSSAATSG